MAGLLAIAGLGALLWFSFNTRLDATLAATHATQAQRAAVAVERPKMSATTIADPRLHAAILNAYRRGFADISYACAALALLGALIAGLTIEGRKRDDGKRDDGKGVGVVG